MTDFTPPSLGGSNATPLTPPRKPLPPAAGEASWNAFFGSLGRTEKVRLAALELALRTGAGLAEGYNLHRAEKFAAFIEGMSPASPEFPKEFQPSDAFEDDDV